jgi:hypothetical protein
METITVIASIVTSVVIIVGGIILSVMFVKAMKEMR